MNYLTMFLTTLTTMQRQITDTVGTERDTNDNGSQNHMRKY